MMTVRDAPWPAGSVPSQETSFSAAAVRVVLQLPWPSLRSGSPLQAEPFYLRWFTDTVTNSPDSRWRNVCTREGLLPVLPKLNVVNEPASSTVAGL